MAGPGRAARPHRPAPRWLIVAAAVIAAATGLGAAFAPYLLVRQPYGLLALNAWPRHQVLIAPLVPLLPFVVVVVVRGVASCAVSFELGRHYGARGTALLEGHLASSGPVVRLVERLFGRFSTLLLLLTPGWLTCALAGMSGVSRRKCLTLNTAGIAGSAVAYHQLGAWLEPWTTPFVQFLRRHMWVATGLCVMLVLVYQGYVTRKQRMRRQLEALQGIEER